MNPVWHYAAFTGSITWQMWVKDRIKTSRADWWVQITLQLWAFKTRGKDTIHAISPYPKSDMRYCLISLYCPACGSFLHPLFSATVRSTGVREVWTSLWSLPLSRFMQLHLVPFVPYNQEQHQTAFKERPSKCFTFVPVIRIHYSACKDTRPSGVSTL